MGDASIIQVFEIVNDGLSNGRKEAKVPRERDPADGNPGGKPLKEVELSYQPFLIGDIQPKGTPNQGHKAIPGRKILDHDIGSFIRFRRIDNFVKPDKRLGLRTVALPPFFNVHPEFTCIMGNRFLIGVFSE